MNSNFVLFRQGRIIFFLDEKINIRDKINGVVYGRPSDPIRGFLFDVVSLARGAIRDILWFSSLYNFQVVTISSFFSSAKLFRHGTQ